MDGTHDNSVIARDEGQETPSSPSPQQSTSSKCHDGRTRFRRLNLHVLLPSADVEFPSTSDNAGWQLSSMQLSREDSWKNILARKVHDRQRRLQVAAVIEQSAASSEPVSQERESCGSMITYGEGGCENEMKRASKLSMTEDVPFTEEITAFPPSSALSSGRGLPTGVGISENSARMSDGYGFEWDTFSDCDIDSVICRSMQAF